ncbi:uncharacterized protein MYCFIDRAFT_176396 [Pseudocercospora fijiensis CIRAD86]|uniref:Uncharacterized protein n=1 Tax=Pseudocercospora fijiensis (strain CIRAD86) TaxID=383855 RepID=M3AUA8_PSEFD|nr:uncharacterized protein MYCFIDRAFT_176396 [Pseudocercospora fijiensis CIRAD86]EME81067.1 hypothetical protein MYCFIDRAFT_176396 [Pseudocercospora fijiensis CIRAD86]
MNASSFPDCAYLAFDPSRPSPLRPDSVRSYAPDTGNYWWRKRVTLKRDTTTASLGTTCQHDITARPAYHVTEVVRTRVAIVTIRRRVGCPTLRHIICLSLL